MASFILRCVLELFWLKRGFEQTIGGGPSTNLQQDNFKVVNIIISIAHCSCHTASDLEFIDPDGGRWTVLLHLCFKDFSFSLLGRDCGSL
jgi:hypothetical protein